LIAGAGFKAGLKERLNPSYSRNLIRWFPRRLIKNISNKVRSTLFRKMISGHKNIIHQYMRFVDIKVCKKVPRFFEKPS
jgi:hypothetical protein